MLKILEKIRLNKYIASSGICSRRQADKHITDGRIKINGEVVRGLGTLVDIDNDRIEFDNKSISPVREKIYIIMNKPVGYITTSKEQFERPYVLQLINEDIRVFSIGRLDMYSEGLILLTNDGDFANQVMHPTKHVEKEYEVILRDNISNTDILKLESGIDIGGYITKKAVVKRSNNVSFNIIIREGKNRQIRKMSEALGNSIVKLKRVRIGGIKLNDLKEGKYKYINYEQAKRVFQNIDIG